MIKSNSNNNSAVKQQAQNQFKKLNQKINSSAQNVFLPRTGIEQALMKERPRFKETNNQFEPINNVNNQMAEEYARLDSEKMLNQNGQNRIVYDCIDQSPFYNDPQDPYIQDIDLIELPSDDLTPE